MTCDRCEKLTAELTSIRARIDRVLSEGPRPLLKPIEQWVLDELISAGARGVSVGYMDDHYPSRTGERGTNVFKVTISNLRRKLGVSITINKTGNAYENRYYLLEQEAAE